MIMRKLEVNSKIPGQDRPQFMELYTKQGNKKNADKCKIKKCVH